MKFPKPERLACLEILTKLSLLSIKFCRKIRPSAMVFLLWAMSISKPEDSRRQPELSPSSRAKTR